MDHIKKIKNKNKKTNHTHIVPLFFLFFFGINTYDLNHLKVDLGIICYIYALCNMLEALHGQLISFVLLPKKIINICN